MNSGHTGDSSQPAERYRWVIEYSLEGDLRFISHHDTLRLFRRALARAALPVRYSEGFNPHPRLTIPLPRSVGIASSAEAIVVDLTEPADSEDVIRKLAPHMPGDIRIRGARQMEPGEKLVPDRVRYHLPAADSPADELAENGRRLLDANVVPIERFHPKDGTTRTIDIRPFIEEITPVSGGVEVMLRVTGSGTARPAEIARLLDLDEEEIRCRIRRTEVQWRRCC